MPQPTGRDLHVDTMLTNISIGYRNAMYIADQICPIVRVQKQSDIVPKYDQSAWFRDEATLRGKGERARRGGFTVDKTDTYYCPRFSYAYEISDEDRDNQDSPFDLDRDGTEFVTDKLQLRRERAFAADFMKTGVWGTDKVGTTDFTKWSDYAGSNPVTDISDFMDAVEALIGREPNTLVMGKQVWLKLKWHPDLIDLIKYTQRGQLTVELMASLLEIARILVGRAIYTTSPEGTAESSVAYTRIWGKDALMLYVPDRPSLVNPAAAYTFVWERVPNAIQYMRRLRDEEREVDIIEGNSYFDQKVTAKTAGLFMDEAVA